MDLQENSLRKHCPVCGQVFDDENEICATCANTEEKNMIPLLAKLSIIISFFIGVVLILIGLQVI